MRERGENDVRAFLEGAGIEKEIHTFAESTHNSELAARTLGVEVGQIAKTILLLVDHSPVAVVISANRRISSSVMTLVISADWPTSYITTPVTFPGLPVCPVSLLYPQRLPGFHCGGDPSSRNAGAQGSAIMAATD